MPAAFVTFHRLALKRVSGRPALVCSTQRWRFAGLSRCRGRGGESNCVGARSVASLWPILQVGAGFKIPLYPLLPHLETKPRAYRGRGPCPAATRVLEAPFTIMKVIQTTGGLCIAPRARRAIE